jgi:opacity protein-like surface antigen
VNSDSGSCRTVRAGGEYAFAANWSAKPEYNYMDFGNKSPSLCPAAGACTTFNIDRAAQVALFGVNDLFSSGAWR